MGNEVAKNFIDQAKHIFIDESKSFFKNIEYISRSELSRCSERLSDTKLDRINNYQEINGATVCGLNAFRLALKLVGVDDSHLPTYSDYSPYCDTTLFIDHGPKPQHYIEFIKKFQSRYEDYNYSYQYGKRQDVYRHNWMRESLQKDNPVICFGSDSLKAHYFVVVGLETKDGHLEYVYALSNGGSLLRMSSSYYNKFTDVSILTVPDMTVITIKEC
jgi:hypothetical protein